MSINTKELIQKMELVVPAINHSSFVPEFRNFHFNGDILFASDGIVSIYTKSPIPEENFSVKADSFLHLLQNLNQEEVKLKIKEDSLSVRTKKLEGKFTIGVPRECSYSIPEGAKGIDTCPKLLDALHLCRFGACKEKTSGAISGVRLEETNVLSTDRFRIHKYDLGIATGLSSCTIPVKFIEILLRRKEEIASYGILEDRFYVVLEDESLIETVIFSGDYPKLEQHFENLDMSRFAEIKFKEDLSKILDKHLKSFLGNVDFFDRELKFAVEGYVCVLFSESKGGGNLLEEVELEEEVGTLEFIVNPTLLQEVLQYGKGKFKYNNEDKMILLDAEQLKILIQTKV